MRETLVNLVAPLASIIAIVVVALVPELEDNIDQIMPVIVTALVLVVGGSTIGQGLAFILASPAINKLLDERIEAQRKAALLTPEKTDDVIVDLAVVVKQVLTEMAAKQQLEPDPQEKA